MTPDEMRAEWRGRVVSERARRPGLWTRIVGEYRECPHGCHHPPWPHSCDGCWCEGERDRREYGWPHDTTPETEEA